MRFSFLHFAHSSSNANGLERRQIERIREKTMIENVANDVWLWRSFSSIHKNPPRGLARLTGLHKFQETLRTSFLRFLIVNLARLRRVSLSYLSYNSIQVETLILLASLNFYDFALMNMQLMFLCILFTFIDRRWNDSNPTETYPEAWFPVSKTWKWTTSQVVLSDWWIGLSIPTGLSAPWHMR